MEREILLHSMAFIPNQWKCTLLYSLSALSFFSRSPSAVVVLRASRLAWILAPKLVTLETAGPQPRGVYLGELPHVYSSQTNQAY